MASQMTETSLLIRTYSVDLYSSQCSQHNLMVLEYHGLASIGVYCPRIPSYPTRAIGMPKRLTKCTLSPESPRFLFETTVSLPCMSNSRKMAQRYRCRVSGATGANDYTQTPHE